MTGITPNAENIRAEMARHLLKRREVCEIAKIHENSLSNYLNEMRPLPAWLAHNLGYAINRATGLRVFNIEMGTGLLPPQRQLFATRGPRKPSPLVLPAPRRRRRRRTPKN